jgi:hypothetical protein
MQRLIPQPVLFVMVRVVHWAWAALVFRNNASQTRVATIAGVIDLRITAVMFDPSICCEINCLD